MIQCKVAGQVLPASDVLCTEKVPCDGCGEQNVHPVCTLTSLYMAHIYCCQKVLHCQKSTPSGGTTNGSRRFLCDKCTQEFTGSCLPGPGVAALGRDNARLYRGRF